MSNRLVKNLEFDKMLVYSCNLMVTVNRTSLGYIVVQAWAECCTGLGYIVVQALAV